MRLASAVLSGGAERDAEVASGTAEDVEQTATDGQELAVELRGIGHFRPPHRHYDPTPAIIHPG